MRIIFFGSYDMQRHPRARVLMQGLAAHGAEIIECNEPLEDVTADRVRVLFRPWLIPLYIVRLGRVWWRLRRMARRLEEPDVIVVGYMGHFDVHLARKLWPETPVILDHLVFLGEAAVDRGVSRSWKLRLLERLDRAAVAKATLTLVDTEEHLALLPESMRGLVVPVGAASDWFSEPDGADDGPMRVVFFGLFTPLHGAEFIGDALGELADADIEFTMVGAGQDHRKCQRRASVNHRVSWLEWVEASELPALVARHDVCLGIFGTSLKALRVVPNKAFQGAAAGCAIITSDTPPQRRLFDNAGIFVPAGDGHQLAQTLRTLEADRRWLSDVRRSCHTWATQNFEPAAIVSTLHAELLRLTGAADR